MFKSGYETYVNDPRELAVDQELDIEIRDCEEYRFRTVKALVSPPGEKREDSHPLWLRSPLGYLFSEEPWSIKINRVLEVR